jgi:hypothetical protein
VRRPHLPLHRSTPERPRRRPSVPLVAGVASPVSNFPPCFSVPWILILRPGIEDFSESVSPSEELPCSLPSQPQSNPGQLNSNF